ncbi:MAG: class I tRNA ligase family protein, partial [Patescibacteria group bacterium]
YTLHVLATLLFDQPAFQNVIVNGILLAEDGEKLSKRKKNYPDPKILFEEKGVDSMRMFLYSSTATLGEDVRFSERFVDEVVKKFTLTLWNTYSFFVTYAKIDGFKPKDKYPNSSHPLDQWVISRLHTLIKEVTEQMDEYNLSRGTRPIFNFVDDLSNWYVRRSRRRFWKSENDEDKNHAYQTLYTVLVELSKLLAPFMPFMADEIYRNLTERESVHLEDWPKHREELIDEDLNEEVALARQIVNLGHALRAKKKIKVRQPLQKVRLALPQHFSEEKLFAQKDVILEELNVKELELVANPKEIAESRVELNARALGPKYGAKVQELIKAAREGKFEMKESGEVSWNDVILEANEYNMIYVGREGEDVGSENGLVLALDTTISPELIQEGLMREVIRLIQDLRKEAGYEVSDHIQVFIKTDGELEKAVTKHADEIKEETLADELQQGGDLEWDIEKEVEIDGMKAVLALKRLKS